MSLSRYFNVRVTHVWWCSSFYYVNDSSNNSVWQYPGIVKDGNQDTDIIIQTVEIRNTTFYVHRLTFCICVIELTSQMTRILCKAVIEKDNGNNMCFYITIYFINNMFLGGRGPLCPIRLHLSKWNLPQGAFSILQPFICNCTQWITVENGINFSCQFSHSLRKNQKTNK